MKKICIILFLVASSFVLISENLFSQIIVTGTVTGTRIDGKLEGAIVRIKGKETKAKSNNKGYYSIKCKSPKDTLIFTFCGYKPYVQKIGKQRKMNVTLVDDTIHMEGVTKVGYDIRKKCDETGKPVIYLYPPTETDVSLRIEYKGTIKTTYPTYNNGWKVKAYPNGAIINYADNKEYSYLFWDGLTDYPENQLTYDNGFVISSDTAMTFLQNILPTMGLKPKEYNELIVYWLPFIQANRLNFIHFRTAEDYDIISKNIIYPQPETQIRVFLEFKPVDSFFNVNPQTFNNIPRIGFTLVEWGGSQLKKPIKITSGREEYTVK